MFEPCTARDVIAGRSRQGITANLPFALPRTHEIRLVILPVSITAGVVVAIVVDAKRQDHVLRIYVIPKPLHQSKLLIGSVAGNAGIDHSILRQRFLQKIAEPFARLGVVAIGERVAEKEESIRRNVAQLSLAQSKTVVSHGNRTIAARLLRGGVWRADPTEFRIELESLPELRADRPADIDDAKQKFGGKKRRDDDQAHHEHAAQQQAAAAL